MTRRRPPKPRNFVAKALASPHLAAKRVPPKKGARAPWQRRPKHPKQEQDR